MNWTTANMELDDIHAQIIGIDMNDLLVRGGSCLYKSTKQNISAILIATVFSLSIFPHLFSWGLYSHLYYISPFNFILHVDS